MYVLKGLANGMWLRPDRHSELIQQIRDRRIASFLEVVYSPYREESAPATVVRSKRADTRFSLTSRKSPVASLPHGIKSGTGSFLCLLSCCCAPFTSEGRPAKALLHAWQQTVL
jgi:hypothetical protein